MGYEKEYLVSNFGEIVKISDKKELKFYTDKYGYRIFSLRKNGKNKAKKAHIAVAESHISKRPSSEHQVNHINGIKSDNRPSNLEWVTSSENVRHSHAMRLAPYGERHHMVTLSDDEIRKLIGENMSYSSLAKKYGVSKSSVHRFKKNKSRIDVSLTEHQKTMIRYGIQNKYCILAADPRLGKTLASIEICRRSGGNNLVICPSYLINNWKREIEKWWPGAVVTTFKKGSEIYDVCDSDFVITSYDLAQKSEDSFEWCDNLILDESHHLKNMAAKKTQFIHKSVYENSIKRVIQLTGTPLKNRVREFYSLISLAYYEPNNTSKFLDIYPDEISFAERFSYRQEYQVKVKTKRGREFQMPIVKYSGIRNIPELKQWLQGIYIRIRAGANDLPPVSYSDILISDSPNKKLLAAFEAYFSGEDTHLVRPDIKVEAAMQKVPFTIKYVENLMETEDCCLVYSDHRDSIKKIAAHFKVPAITGEMSGTARAKMVSDFQSGKINMICSTIGALKEGADLYRAKDIIFNDICWIPGDMIQVENRIRKVGNSDPRRVHRLLGSPQDEKILEAINEKMRVIDAAT